MGRGRAPSGKLPLPGGTAAGPGAPRPRTMHHGSCSFFAHRSSPDSPGGCAGDPRALRGAGRAGRAQCGRAWAGGGYQVTVSVCLSICVCIPPPGTAPRAPGGVAAKMAAVAEAGASWAPPPARSRRVSRSEAAPLLRRPKAKRSSGQPGPREWRPAVEEEPGRVTSPPARGEPPSPAPGAARCPFPVPFPWWRRGRAGAVGQGSGPPGWGLGAGSGLGGRCGAAGKPCGSGGLCGPRPSHRAGRVIRSPRRRRRVRGSGGALSRARLPTQPAALGLWRREGAGSLPAAPGPGAPGPPQAVSGAAGRAARPSLAPEPAPLAATRPAGPALGACRWHRSGSGRRRLRALGTPRRWKLWVPDTPPRAGVSECAAPVSAGRGGRRFALLTAPVWWYCMVCF